MPRDVSGTYTAPSNSFNPAVTATIIDPNDWNAVLLDMVAQGFNVLPAALLNGNLLIANFNSGLNASATTFFRGDGTWAPAVIGPNASSDNAIARYDATTGKIIQDSVITVADTTGALAKVGGGGVPIQGTNTNNSAAAGDVGELFSNTAGATALTTNVAVNVGQIALTAGDWDIYATNHFSGSGTPSVTNLRLGINTTSATLPSIAPFQYSEVRFNTGVADYVQTMNAGPFRVSITGTTTYYAVAIANWTTGTYSANGAIRARRVR